MANYSERLAAFVAGLSLDQVPGDVVRYAKLLVLDQLGCQIAFATRPWSARYRTGVLAMGAAQGATVVYYGDKVTVSDAAFLNSAFGHGDEFDDTHIKSPTHPGAVVIPAVLAVAEHGRRSGRDVLEATIAGYEVQLRLSIAGSPYLHERGHHSPTAVGVFGAAAGAARLLDQDAEGCLHALAIAGSHAAGLLEYTQAGGSVKRIHCAIPAQAGVRSAVFAQQGITGPRSVLEGKRGFFRVFAEDAKLDTIVDRLGELWRIMEVGFKPYNCCYYIHTQLEALDELVGKHRLSVDDIAHITVGSSDQGSRHTGVIKEPVDILAAQFSNSFSLAVRLLRGGNEAKDYREEDLRDPRFLELASRIDTVVDPICEAEHPGNFSSILTIVTRDGRRLEHRERFSRGLIEKPMSEADLTRKFMDLAAPNIGAAAAEQIVAYVAELERRDDVSELLKLMVSATRAPALAGA